MPTTCPRRRTTARFATGPCPILGCLALLALTSCALSPSTGGTPPTGGNGDGQQTTDTNPPNFTVTLSVSNSTPQLNEEVFFRCTAGGDFSQPVSFVFQTSDVSLQAALFGGTASFIVTETELGQGIDVTCSGTDADGTTATSGRATVFPTG